MYNFYDKGHMSAVRIKNRSESDPRSYEVIKTVYSSLVQEVRNIKIVLAFGAI